MNAQTPIVPGDNRQRKRRISPEILRAIEIVATEGLPTLRAAERVGVHPVTLYKAFAKPHIKAVLEQRKADGMQDLEAIKGLSKVAAYRVGLDLMHNSPDHKVRAKMVELFAGETRQPTVAVQINNAPAQGYTYRRADHPSAPDDAQVIDGQAEPGKAE
jgi:predicted secreted protein